MVHPNRRSSNNHRDSHCASGVEPANGEHDSQRLGQGVDLDSVRFWIPLGPLVRSGELPLAICFSRVADSFARNRDRD